MRSPFSLILRLALLIGFGIPSWSASFAAHADAIVLYDSQGFEAESGYDSRFLLDGQMDWVAQGTGGSGLVTNFFAGRGQQAFIGYFPPTQVEDSLNVWRPVNLSPARLQLPLIRFSVTMQIVDSTTNRYDDFRWSVYNTNGHRLFTLDFDNFTGAISYGLDGTNSFVDTGFTFSNDGAYDLQLNMNFAANTWSATLNDVVFVNGKKITTVGADLSLGDIDAVWAIRDAKNPGDNYMVFDDYKIEGEAATALPVRLESLALLPRTGYLMRVHGEPGRNYAMEVSDDLFRWRSIRTNTAPVPGGVFEYLDDRATNQPVRFYRARLLNP